MVKTKRKKAPPGMKKIPSLLEKMKSTWKKINSTEPKNIKLDKADQQTIKEAFIAADNYTELQKLRVQAYELFIDKDKWSEEEDKRAKDEKKQPKDKHRSTYNNKLKEAIEIMGILPDATRKGRKKRFHPKKDEEIREYYTRFDAFYFKGKDGLYYDDEGNAGEIEEDYKKKIIVGLQKKFGFGSPRAATEYLRKTFGFKNLPDFRDNNKNQGLS
jgi:hypothetical protein